MNRSYTCVFSTHTSFRWNFHSDEDRGSFKVEELQTSARASDVWGAENLHPEVLMRLPGLIE